MTGPPDGHAQARAAQVGGADRAEASLPKWAGHTERLVLVPPAGHRLVVRSVCQVNGCTTTATNKRHICFSCQRRLQEAGLSDNELGAPSRAPAKPRRATGACLVAGCGREQASAPAGLCGTHLDQAKALGLAAEAFFAHPAVGPLAPTGPCLVVACVPPAPAPRRLLLRRPSNPPAVGPSGRPQP